MSQRAAHMDIVQRLNLVVHQDVGCVIGGTQHCVVLSRLFQRGKSRNVEAENKVKLARFKGHDSSSAFGNNLELGILDAGGLFPVIVKAGHVALGVHVKVDQLVRAGAAGGIKQRIALFNILFADDRNIFGIGQERCERVLQRDLKSIVARCRNRSDGGVIGLELGETHGALVRINDV